MPEEDEEKEKDVNRTDSHQRDQNIRKTLYRFKGLKAV